jgi:hypothetical protein
VQEDKKSYKKNKEEEISRQAKKRGYLFEVKEMNEVKKVKEAMKTKKIIDTDARDRRENIDILTSRFKK